MTQVYLDRVWDFFFLQNATETRINIGSGDKGLRSKQWLSELELTQGTLHYHCQLEATNYTNRYTNSTFQTTF